MLRRGLEGQTVVDGSWVSAQRPDGTLDRSKMFGATALQWPAWVGGTAVGALLSPSTELLRDVGLDVVFPSFFLVLLLDALRTTRSGLPIAVFAFGLAAASVAALPAGVALLVSGLAAVLAAGRRHGADRGGRSRAAGREGEVHG
jgi:predicted branched-subunit amino acid permease